MGQYYNPETVKRDGEKVPTNKAKQGRFSHRLVAILDRTVETLAVDVTKPSEMEEFYGQYSIGMWLTIDFYDYQPPKE